MKTIIVDGYKFTLCDGEKYHYNTKLRKTLHRYLYEKEYGEIPEGYEVHHIDHNTLNNNLSNLIALPMDKHKEIHKKEMTDEQLEALRNNLDINARPKAIEWHKSEIGKEWHKRHYKKMKEKLHTTKEIECLCCGKRVIVGTSKENKFCSDKCKSKYRRKKGLDNEIRICVTCGKEFTINKYSKTQNCSKSCAAKMRHNKNKLKDSPNLQE